MVKIITPKIKIIIAIFAIIVSIFIINTTHKKEVSIASVKEEKLKSNQEARFMKHLTIYLMKLCKMQLWKRQKKKILAK